MINFDDTKIAEAWIKFTKSKRESDVYENNFWAFQAMSDLSHDNAERALDIIMEILSIDNSDTITGMLGAGPMEDLLGIHGTKVVERIERLASHNPDVVRVLKGVWNTGIDPDTWARLSKIISGD